MFLFDKIKSKYFCRAKIQKEKHRSKNSLYYTEKNSSFVDVFLEKIINYFTQKRFAQIVERTSFYTSN